MCCSCSVPLPLSAWGLSECEIVNDSYISLNCVMSFLCAVAAKRASRHAGACARVRPVLERVVSPSNPHCLSGIARVARGHLVRAAPCCIGSMTFSAELTQHSCDPARLDVVLACLAKQEIECVRELAGVLVWCTMCERARVKV